MKIAIKNKNLEWWKWLLISFAILIVLAGIILIYGWLQEGWFKPSSSNTPPTPTLKYYCKYNPNPADTTIPIHQCIETTAEHVSGEKLFDTKELCAADCRNKHYAIAKYTCKGNKMCT